MVTKNYIKQCEQAEEIQKLCEYRMGDWFYTTIYRRGKHKGFYVIDVDYGDNYPYGLLPDKHKKDNFITKGGGVWLPTQEQLQQMVWQITKKGCEYTYCISKHYLRKDHFTLCVLDVRVFDASDNSILAKYTGGSIHECLIQHIYDYRYHKIWTGEKWTKEGGN